MASVASAHGQSSLRLVDATTDEPVTNATVRFRSFGTTDAGKSADRRSDARGMVINPFAARAAVAISHIGYTTLYDTLEATGERTIRLQPKSISSQTVVVTGQSTPTSSDRSLMAVRVIDRAQIESRSAQSLRDLMAGEVGIGLSNDLVLGTSLSLQGLSGQNVKILVDGVPVVGRVGGSIDLSQIPLANADRVEIIEGPMSVLYGTDALGGVINIITAKRTRGSLSASAHGYYESVGSYTADTRVGGFVGDTRIWVAGGRTLFTGFANPDTTRSKRWKPREQSTVDADITQFLGSHTVGISANFLDDYILNRGIPRSPYGETAFDDTYRTRRTTLRMLAQGSLTDDPYEISVAYSGYARRKNTFLKNLVTLETTMTSGASENDTSSVDTWNVRARLSGKMPIESMTWDAGGDATIEDITGARIADREQRQSDYALYGRIEYAPTSFLSLQPGVRVTYNTRYTAPIVPSLHLKISPDSAFVIRASYGRGFRAPSLQDLYFTFVDINHNIHGNPDLRAEKSHNFNAGATYTQRSAGSLLETGVNGYYNAVHDLITLVADSGDLYLYKNIGDVRTVGGTLSSSIRWQEGMARVNLGLTGSSSGLPEQEGVPDFTVTPELGAEARWKVLPEIEIASDYKYTARVPHYALDANNEVVRRLSDDYHILNASVAYTFFGDRATIRAGVRNIANVTDISIGTAAQASAHSDGSTNIAVAWGRSFILDIQLRVP